MCYVLELQDIGLVIGLKKPLKILKSACQSTKPNLIRKPETRLKVEDEVVVLLPKGNSKLLESWQGPFPVLEKLSKLKLNYIVSFNGVPEFQINLLKKYVRRDPERVSNATDCQISSTNYASPSSGEAYRDRQLTTNFDLKFFVCRHVSI